MGLLKNPTNHPEKQETARRRGGPRARRCLLKGCERRFCPRQSRQRYCCGECRKAAEAWSRWKAQQRYRAAAAGKQRRNGQSRRYRERVKNRKLPADESVPDAARVITKDFFRCLLRPARLLRTVRAATAIAAATLLFTTMPVCAGTRPRARAALEEDARRLSGASR